MINLFSTNMFQSIPKHVVDEFKKIYIMSGRTFFIPGKRFDPAGTDFTDIIKLWYVTDENGVALTGNIISFIQLYGIATDPVPNPRGYNGKIKLGTQMTFTDEFINFLGEISE